MNSTTVESTNVLLVFEDSKVEIAAGYFNTDNVSVTVTGPDGFNTFHSVPRTSLRVDTYLEKNDAQ